MRHEQVAAHAADGYARQTGKTRLRGDHRRARLHQRHDRCRQRLSMPKAPMLHIGGQGALTQHKMGSLQDLPHVDMMQPITKFAATVPSTPSASPTWSRWPPANVLTARPGPRYLEIPRDVLDARCRAYGQGAKIPAPGHYRASTKSIGDPNDIERLADLLVKSERPCILLGQQLWTCRGAEPRSSWCDAQCAGLFQRRRARHAAAGRPALLPPHPAHAFDKADVIVIVGTPFDFRMGYGKRLRQDATVVQIDMDYRTVGKNRDVSSAWSATPARSSRR